MNTRIREIRNDYHLTQDAFAERIKVKRNTVATYEMGRSIPSDSAIALICKTFRVNENWLRYGTGAKYYDITAEEEIAEFFGELQSDDPKFAFKKRLITALAHMDDSGWDAIEKLIMEATKKDHD